MDSSNKVSDISTENANSSKGKKKALVVGLNYVGTEDRLNGAVNDARRFKKAIMEHWNFREDDINLIVDESEANQEILNPSISDEIYAGFRSLVKGAEEGDVLIFYYSGHGTRFKCEQYHNNTGHVEMLDFPDSIITDRNLRVYAETIPIGCSFTVILDCCHSGGMIENADEQLGDSTEVIAITKLKVMVPIVRPFDVAPTKRPLGILLSACQSYERALDLQIDVKGSFGGYFTEELIKLINERKTDLTNYEVIYKIRKAAKKIEEYEKEMFDMDPEYCKEEDLFRMNPGLYCGEDQIHLQLFSMDKGDVYLEPTEDKKVDDQRKPKNMKSRGFSWRSEL